MRNKYILLSAIIYGSLVSIPSASQFEINASRFTPSFIIALSSVALFFILSIVTKGISKSATFFQIIGIIIGSSLSYSFIRQEVIIICLSAIWSAPAIFFAQAISALLMDRKSYLIKS
jgi:hypothetical protein